MTVTTEEPVHLAPATLDFDDPRRLPMFVGDTRAAIGWEQLLQAVAWADVVIIGELHDDLMGHRVEQAIVADAMVRHPRAALSMEMLERDEQGLVDDYLENIIDQDAFVRRTFSRHWGGDDAWWDFYQPAVDSTKTAGAPLIAANAPRRYVRLARTEGYESLRALPRDRRRLVDLPRGEPDPAYLARFDAAMRDIHTGTAETPDTEEETAEVGGEPADAGDDAVDTESPSDDAVPATRPDDAPTTAPYEAAADEVEAETEEEEEPAPEDDDEADADAPPAMMQFVMDDAQVAALFRSQRVWDATMAGSIAAARRAGARPVVHLVGGFHCEFDGGLVHELRRQRPSDTVLVIALERSDALRLREEDRGRADIVIHTGAPLPEPEPEEEEEEEEEDNDEAEDGGAGEDEAEAGETEAAPTETAPDEAAPDDETAETDQPES
jgi:uncharacterized iron-regulated protein